MAPNRRKPVSAANRRCKTLLIDNYDSYTYNLYQLISQTYQCEPLVLLNDAVTIEEVKQILEDEGITSIIISPGPGHPDNPKDTGICPDLFRRFVDMPILGVCLGHQILGSVYGATTTRVLPMHGRLSEIAHNGHALFKHIPTSAADFEVVRYHSLAVDPSTLPSCLEPIAWTQGGSHAMRCPRTGRIDPVVLMGLAHTHYPHYGVQFHPESIATMYGAQLLANFHHLTSEMDIPLHTNLSHRHLTNEHHISNEISLEIVWQKLDGFLKRIDVDDLFDAVYQRNDYKDTFWLDSAAKDRCRFSFMGGLGGNLWRKVTYRLRPSSVEKGEAVIRDIKGRETKWSGSIWDYLDEELKRYRATPLRQLPFSFCGGFVGFLGYELKALSGGKAAHEASTPDAELFFADRFLAIDHKLGDIYCMALVKKNDRISAEKWIATTVERIKRHRISHRPSPSLIPRCSESHFELDRDREQYEADIERCMEALYAGESYEICLTNQYRKRNPGLDARLFYRQLRQRNPAPYAAWLKFERLTVCCSSPERFLKGDSDGNLEARPIKGTAARFDDPTLDTQSAEELRDSEKNQAESLMIVDLLRNDLGRVCQPFSVHVPSLMEIESHATVHQMVTTVRGKRRPELTNIDAIRAAFPGGSMTGAPKIRTMEIIDNLEGAPRGVYSGAIGYLSVTNSFDLNVVIRTAVLTKEEITIGCGGAIVLQSDPYQEYLEIILKARALIDTIIQCEHKLIS